MNTTDISLAGLVRRFWPKAIFTWLLVVLEGLFLLVIPLVIGWAVDDLIRGDVKGVIQLVTVLFLLLFVGAARRFYDTRVYSGIYKTVSNELVLREHSRDTPLSTISARANLFLEFTEFLENSLPDFFNQFVGMAGTLCIIAFINLQVFFSCLAGAVLSWAIFALSRKKMLLLNHGQNDELENQVAVIAAGKPDRIRKHFSSLMTWNIRLSDLETMNFSFTWVILSGVLIYSVVTIASPGTASFGQMVSMVMYVFGFIDSVMTFPLYYQQVIRLSDIAARLS